ncbi:hypothetical protein ABZ864_45835 [Streptomyces sp. NPDC047082]|uniref:hypothetical protein n=1 Tax=Streptomyces sp. NPDC047082 TaxID=3155259 RepID=UPI0033E07498
MSDLSARTDHSSAPDPLRSVYLRLVAEESIPEEARGQFSYLQPLATDLLAGIALDTPDNVRVLSDRDVALVEWDTLAAAARTNLLSEPVNYDTLDLPGGAVLHILGHPESVFAASKVLVFDGAVRATDGPEIPDEGVPRRHPDIDHALRPGKSDDEHLPARRTHDDHASPGRHRQLRRARTHRPSVATWVVVSGAG